MRPYPSGEAMSVERYAQEELQIEDDSEGRIVEKYCLNQHPWYASVNPTSLNTLRVFVRSEDDDPLIVGGYLRMGRKGSAVDNGTCGGIRSNFEVDTGILGEAYGDDPGVSTHNTHPDTGVQLKGTVLPGWNALPSIMARALDVLPKITFAAFDLAMTTDGPIVIELNVRPDRCCAAYLDIPQGDIIGLQERG